MQRDMEFLSLRKRSFAAGATGAAPTTSTHSNRLLIVSAIANIVTLVVAAVALQMAIASSSDRQKSKEDQTRQLQELAATVESLRQSLGDPASLVASVATSQRGNVQPQVDSNIGAPRSQKADRPALVATSPTVLQVAAVPGEADALALATELQKKGFPAFVLEPQTDQYYRVQVGAYASDALAKRAQQQLKNLGFESFIKHPRAGSAQ